MKNYPLITLVLTILMVVSISGCTSSNNTPANTTTEQSTQTELTQTDINKLVKGTCPNCQNKTLMWYEGTVILVNGAKVTLSQGTTLQIGSKGIGSFNSSSSNAKFNCESCGASYECNGGKCYEM